MSTMIQGVEYHKIKDLFADPNRWNRYATARDENGPCHIHSPDAISCCLLGAVIRIYPQSEHTAILDRIRMATTGSIMGSVGMWSDDAGHEKVLELVTRLDL